VVSTGDLPTPGWGAERAAVADRRPSPSRRLLRGATSGDAPRRRRALRRAWRGGRVWRLVPGRRFYDRVCGVGIALSTNRDDATGLALVDGSDDGVIVGARESL